MFLTANSIYLLDKGCFCDSLCKLYFLRNLPCSSNLCWKLIIHGFVKFCSRLSFQDSCMVHSLERLWDHFSVWNRGQDCLPSSVIKTMSSSGQKAGGFALYQWLEFPNLGITQLWHKPTMCTSSTWTACVTQSILRIKEEPTQTWSSQGLLCYE